MNNKLTIEVESKLVYFKIEIKHKVTVITGHSGVGKSVLTRAIVNDSGKYKKKIPSGYVCSVIYGENWMLDFKLAVNDSKDLKNVARIFIFDDVDYMKTDYFSTLFKEDKRNFYIFINRFISINESSLGRIPYSIYSVYNLVTDGRNHWLEPKYNFEVKPDNYYDYVITEDSTSGLEFLKGYNINVSSSKSKDNIISMLRSNMDLLKAKKVLIFVDLASFGSCIRKVIEFAQSNNLSVSFVPDYQCFEYLLLTSNLVKKLKSKEMILAYSSNISNVAKFSSLEKLYESLLSYITKNTVLHQGHGGELNVCYCIDCKDCHKNKKKFSCNYGLKGNKQEALIQGTQWEGVLTAVSNSELIELK